MATPNSLTLQMPIAFDEADAEGIVFFGNYFRLAHRALERYLPLIGIPWEEWFQHSDYGVPLRHVAADYMEPIRPGEVLEVEIKVRELSENSVTFVYEFRLGERLATQLVTSHVFVSRQTRRKTAIPEKLRARLISAPK